MSRSLTRQILSVCHLQTHCRSLRTGCAFRCLASSAAAPGSSNSVNSEFINRNPRNLEQMGIAKKRKGWELQRPRVKYYHKLKFDVTNKHTSALIQHSSGKIVLSASTKEFAIGKHLYSSVDVAAAINIGRVLAQRCLETGITCVSVDRSEFADDSERYQLFLQQIEKDGLSLEEPEEIRPEYIPGIDYDDEDAMADLARRRALVEKENPRKFGTKKSFQL